MAKSNLNGWRSFFQGEKKKSYFLTLKSFVKEERKHTLVYPPRDLIFKAFELTHPQEVKVVILGQDPYHGAGQAQGLSFSVPPGFRFPPSLRNIFKELANEYADFELPRSGDLTPWAEQGVLLLNSILTVRAKEAGSHQNKGWEIFTDAVIRYISDECQHVVFMLWGRYAGEKISLIDINKHLVLTSSHPSPFSAHRGFFGNNHFVKANEYLKTHHRDPIQWNLQGEKSNTI